MRSRNGVSLIETLVVIAIIGLMLGFLLPVIQTTRTRALEVVCRNNVKQINLAMAQFVQDHKKLPVPATPGFVGGWTIEVFPYLEQQNLRDQIAPGTPIAVAPEFLRRRPTIMA